VSDIFVEANPHGEGRGEALNIPIIRGKGENISPSKVSAANIGKIDFYYSIKP
jgi:hypothetical protein